MELPRQLKHNHVIISTTWRSFHHQDKECFHLMDRVESATLWRDVDGAGHRGVGGQAAPLAHLHNRAMFLKLKKDQITPPQKSDVCQGFKNSNLTSPTDVCQVQVQITPVSILAVCPGLPGCRSYTRTCLDPPLALGMGWNGID